MNGEWGHPCCSDSALDCWSTGRAIDPAPRGMIYNIIHLISPGCPRSSIALTVHNRGLKHFISFHMNRDYTKYCLLYIFFYILYRIKNNSTSNLQGYSICIQNYYYAVIHGP